MTPLHLGALHPVEQALTIALAIGPFVVLGVVIMRRRHQDRDSEALEALEAEGQRDK